MAEKKSTKKLIKIMIKYFKLIYVYTYSNFIKLFYNQKK